MIIIDQHTIEWCAHVCTRVCVFQIEGAFLQGLGLYTMEELKFSPSGVLYKRGPSQYKIPAVCDIPLKFNTYLLAGSDNSHAIYSSKVCHSLYINLSSLFSLSLSLSYRQEAAQCQSVRF